MSDSEIADLCRRIYSKHQRALDLIYEHRPDRQAIIQKTLKDLIQQRDDLVLDSSSKKHVYFSLKPLSSEEKDWTPSGRMLPFLFINGTDNLILKILIGDGPQETRQKLFKMALKPPFKPVRKNLTDGWLTIYQRHFLKPESYEDTSDDEIVAKIKQQWLHFLNNELPKIQDTVMKHEWV